MNTLAVTEQASEPSVEERAAAALFGSPAPKAAPAAPEAPEPTDPEETAPPEAELTEAPEATEPVADETFEFELDGEKWALPKKLEKAIQNNRDYTQKSQEIANQRRTFEALNEQANAFRLTQEFNASVAQEMQQLQAYDSVLSQPLDPSLPEGDILRAMIQRNQWKDQRDAIARSINEKHQQYKQNYDKSLTEMRSKALEAVTKRVPGWNDALWTSVREHAKADGYTDVELGAIADPRHQITLWKAQQYDSLKSKAVKTVADVKAVKTTPSNPMPQHVKDNLAFKKQLAKAQSPAEKSKLAEARIGAMFAKR